MQAELKACQPAIWPFSGSNQKINFVKIKKIPIARIRRKAVKYRRGEVTAGLQNDKSRLEQEAQEFQEGYLRNVTEPTCIDSQE